MWYVRKSAFSLYMRITEAISSVDSHSFLLPSSDTLLGVCHNLKRQHVA